ncbi:MAG TPA: ribonuclease E inhibitor RraB [Flavobacteriaceae bacterium]|nr:ribonuclease E inhibitor RraB [Flavobacteriaceae bacterium]
MKSPNSSNPKSDKNKFVHVKDFEVNLDSQDQKTSRVLGVMNKFSLTTKKESEIEFFFYAATKEKAKQLAAELQKLKYDVYVEKHRDRFSISGWTTKMNIENERISYWAKHMCQLGYKFDCEFDGWGMFVDEE